LSHSDAIHVSKLLRPNIFYIFSHIILAFQSLIGNRNRFIRLQSMNEWEANKKLIRGLTINTQIECHHKISCILCTNTVSLLFVCTAIISQRIGYKLWQNLQNKSSYVSLLLSHALLLPTISHIFVERINDLHIKSMPVNGMNGPIGPTSNHQTHSPQMNETQVCRICHTSHPSANIIGTTITSEHQFQSIYAKYIQLTVSSKLSFFRVSNYKLI
jgi:hypothetical protein